MTDRRIGYLSLSSKFRLTQGKFKEADVRFQRALAMFEKVYGQDHQKMALHLTNRAELLKEQVRETKRFPK